MYGTAESFPGSRNGARNRAENGPLEGPENQGEIGMKSSGKPWEQVVMFGATQAKESGPDEAPSKRVVRRWSHGWPREDGWFEVRDGGLFNQVDFVLIRGGATVERLCEHRRPCHQFDERFCQHRKAEDGPCSL